jgi:hypothetical protein
MECDMNPTPRVPPEQFVESMKEEVEQYVKEVMVRSTRLRTGSGSPAASRSAFGEELSRGKVLERSSPEGGGASPLHAEKICEMGIGHRQLLTRQEEPL